MGQLVGAVRHSGATLTSFDVAVVGAGFGGLAAALRLAERGARVVVLETLRYPGGCASTFTRGGHRFESGATLFSGLGAGQLFARWIEEYRLDVAIDWIDPIAELRAPALRLVVGRDRDALLRQLEALPGCPVPALRRFFARQRRVADVLWTLLDDPSLLPPLDVANLARHALRAPAYLPLLGVVGRSLGALLRAHGLDGFAPLATYLNALCQITVQCAADEAEAPFALGTMDYWYRGTAHVRGGIGNLAWGLVDAIRQRGGDVRLASRVRRIVRDGDGWRVVTRHGTLGAAHVVANLLPQDVARLVDDAPPSLASLGDALDDGWGACMQYLVVRPDAVPSPAAHHVQVVQDPSAPFVEGNHFFCSVGDASEGERRVTVSTHVPLRRLYALSPEERGAYVAGIQERVRAGLRAHVPEWADAVSYALTASPRTFERFTGRARGCVGGIPRRRGLGHYLSMFPPTIAPGLHLVGDTMFPGQSTLAAALGGLRAAERVALASRAGLS